MQLRYGKIAHRLYNQFRRSLCGSCRLHIGRFCFYDTMPKQNPEQREKYNAYMRKWSRANKKRVNERRRERRLTDGTLLAKQRAYVAANSEKIKEKRKIYAKKIDYRNRDKTWDKMHPDKIREYKRKWNHNNPEKCNLIKKRRIARMSNTIINLSSQQIVDIKKTGCLFCGSMSDLVVAHDTPVAKGGNTVRGNLFCLCRSCNLTMNVKTLAEMIRQKTLF